MELRARVLWHTKRLLEWLDKAALGQLFQPGDPLELPALPGLADLPLVGFSEDSQGLADWLAKDRKWGFARIGEVPNARAHYFVTEFLSPKQRILKQCFWSESLRTEAAELRGLWLRLPTIPVLTPWQAPSNWSELSQRIAQDDCDLSAILVEAGRLRRKSKALRTQRMVLLLGFPLANNFGEPSDRLHWWAISDLPLHDGQHRDGFRQLGEAHFERSDAAIATSTLPLSWRKTQNWACDQIRRRGAAEDAVKSKKVLIIGVGTLGAAVAENLLRMGVTSLAVMDSDQLEMGNLSRHTLTMADLGKSKAEAVATRLREIQPDSLAMSISAPFPPQTARLTNLVRSFDVIIDCTASDRVLDAMADFDWGAEKTFVSLSMTWRSEGLIAFSASEAMFPALDARDRFNNVLPSAVDADQGQTEGIGCWHPIFPATADDVQLWAAVGSKFVRRAITSKRRLCEYFQQNADAEVTRRHA